MTHTEFGYMRSSSYESYKPEKNSHAIRHSLKGDASRVAMHLGSGASTISILKTLDSIYGIVAERENLQC